MAEFAAYHDVWQSIEGLSNRCRSKKAAVSYVTSDALVKFRQEDMLVVDASDDAILSGRTSGSVIQRAITRGARVVNVPHLHAKVMLFDGTAVVGSANISVRSASHLIEAVLSTRQRSVVRRVSEWIDELGNAGQEVDDDLLQYLLSLESQRPPIRRAHRALANPHIVFFKQVMAGDIEKYRTRSSTAGTGGGARDLRVSPATVFQPLLRQMFAERHPNRKVTQGKVLSRIGRAPPAGTAVELWPPTKARRNEIRIARFYEVPGWEVEDARFQRAEEAGQRLFYVLEMDVHGTVTAKVLSQRQLASSNRVIGQHIKELASRAARGRSVIGAVDVVREVAVPAV